MKRTGETKYNLHIQFQAILDKLCATLDNLLKQTLFYTQKKAFKLNSISNFQAYDRLTNTFPGTTIRLLWAKFNPEIPGVSEFIRNGLGDNLGKFQRIRRRLDPKKRFLNDQLRDIFL